MGWNLCWGAEPPRPVQTWSRVWQGGRCLVMRGLRSPQLRSPGSSGCPAPCPPPPVFCRGPQAAHPPGVSQTLSVACLSPLWGSHGLLEEELGAERPPHHHCHCTNPPHSPSGFSVSPGLQTPSKAPSRSSSWVPFQSAAAQCRAQPPHGPTLDVRLRPHCELREGGVHGLGWGSWPRVGALTPSSSALTPCQTPCQVR